jgi:hypothetical protein
MSNSINRISLFKKRIFKMVKEIFLSSDMIQFGWGITLVGLLLIIGLLIDERLRNSDE